MRIPHATAAVAVALLITAGPTHAADSLNAPSADEAIEAISQLDDAPVAKAVTEASSPADLPDEAGNSIEFDQTDFAITIPGNAEVEQVAGASVYEQTQPGTTTVVQPTRQGAQILTVLDSAASATNHAYQMQIPAGGQAIQNADGSIAVTDGEGTPEVTIATPWAQDATGRDLPTHYTLHDNTLTQHIDTTGATFPVVADPKVTFESDSTGTKFVVARVLQSSDPSSALSTLDGRDRAAFRRALENGGHTELQLSAPLTTPLPAVAAQSKCRDGSDFASAAGRHTIAGVGIYEYFLDIKYFYDCGGVTRVKITGSTGKPLAPGWSFEGAKDRTAVVQKPSKARAKANFLFRYKYGPFEGQHASCLGINITVTKYARVVNNDLSCRTNP